MRFSQIWLIPFICFLMTAYFIFHAVQGHHGLKRMKEVQQEIAIANQIKEESVREKERLQAKVNALYPQSLDLDQLSESAARILNMGSSQMRVIF